MAKKILLLIVLCIVLIFVFKNNLASSFIKYYVKSEFEAECAIGRVEVFLGGIEIKGLELKTKDFKATLNQAMVALDFHQLLRIKDIELTINGADFEVSDLVGFQKVLMDKYGLLLAIFFYAYKFF